MDVLASRSGRRPIELHPALVGQEVRQGVTVVAVVPGIAAYSEFAADVATGAFPQPEHLVPVSDDVHEQFLTFLDTVE